MTERVVTFGAQGFLTGVLCEPDLALAAGQSKRAPGAPAVIVSNVGLNHRVGPFRFNVDLARRLAAHGISTLRFDLAGLGDSAPRSDTRTDLDGAIADTREAMNFLATRKGFERFVLVGFCSGTDLAHALAVSDPRVAGAAFIDGYTYPTTKFLVRKHLLKFLSERRWRRFVRWRLAPTQVRLGAQDEIYVREYPPREQMIADVETMLARNVRLLYVYSGGVSISYNYREQFFEMLRPAKFEGRVEHEYYERADHLFTSPDERKKLLDRLERWVEGVSRPTSQS